MMRSDEVIQDWKILLNDSTQLPAAKPPDFDTSALSRRTPLLVECSPGILGCPSPSFHSAVLSMHFMCPFDGFEAGTIHLSPTMVDLFVEL
jgi:hypothetical protein